MFIDLKKRLDARERTNENPLMHQDWKHLLFLHWEVEVEKIQSTLPEGLFTDTFEGKAYITISPLESLKIWNFPSVPGLSNFIEVNARTYVHDNYGIPGIWFYSLDINSLIASNAARAVFSLPYYFSYLTQNNLLQNFVIEGARGQSEINMKFSYQPLESHARKADPDSLDFFLIERYVLFSLKSGQLHYQRVHHLPYHLKEVAVNAFETNLLVNEGISTTQSPHAIHYSPGVSVDIFEMKKIK